MAWPSNAQPSSGAVDESDLNRLRDLLLVNDREQARSHSEQIETEIARRLVRDDFHDILVGHLANALRKAEQGNPKAMARALSPAVVSSIRREIVNSRDDMVQALFPITGRLVQAAVRDAIGKLAASINERLNSLTSPSFLKAYAKSLLLRRPLSDFLIAGQIATKKYKRALFIDRQSGALHYIWNHEDSSHSEREDDAVLVSSMFAAISAFAAERYGRPDAELRTLDLDGRHVILRYSPRLMLVVECEGKISDDDQHHFDDVFTKLLECANDREALADIDVLAVKNPQATGARQQNSLRLALVVLALIISGCIAWTVWDRIWFEREMQLVSAFVRQSAPRHAPNIESDRLGRTITLRGLVPAEFNTSELHSQMQQDGVAFIDATQAVAGSKDVAELSGRITMQASTYEIKTEQQRADMEQKFALTEAGLRDQLAGIRSQIMDLQMSQAALASQQTLDKDQISGALDSINRIDRQSETLSITYTQRAIRSIEATSIKFDQADVPLDAASFGARLSQVAVLANVFGFIITVEGYADTTGTEKINQKISAARAEAVGAALVALGLPRDQISMVGRGATPDGSGSTDRQVRLKVTVNRGVQ